MQTTNSGEMVDYKFRIDDGRDPRRPRYGSIATATFHWRLGAIENLPFPRRERRAGSMSTMTRTCCCWQLQLNITIRERVTHVVALVHT